VSVSGALDTGAGSVGVAVVVVSDVVVVVVVDPPEDHLEPLWWK
jgi:hypothetical protein